jgi:hypothetical protein
MQRFDFRPNPTTHNTPIFSAFQPALAPSRVIDN